MTKTKAMIAIVTGLLSAAAAQATAYPVTFTAGTYTANPTPVTTGGATVYTDTFTFTTTAALSSFSGSLTTQLQTDPFSGATASNLNFLSVFLDNTAFARSADSTDANETYSLARTLLTGIASHTVTVNYTVPTASATNGARYGGVFNLAVAPVSNVPEPAGWMLMVAGFGVLGATMRRGGRAALSLR